MQTKENILRRADILGGDVGWAADGMVWANTRVSWLLVETSIPVNKYDAVY